MSSFTFDPARERVPSPQDLSITDRQLLRDLCTPGLPLWKVLRQLSDYRDGLLESLSDPKVDVWTDEGRKAYMKVQTSIHAINDLFNRIEQAVNDPNEED